MEITKILIIVLFITLYSLIIYQPKKYKSFSELNNINKKIMITKFILFSIFSIIYTIYYLKIIINNSDIYTTITAIISFSLFIIFLVLIKLLDKIKEKKIIKKLIINNKYKKYILKEIPITSLIFITKRKISYNKSIKLTILNLYCKNAIDMEINNNEIKIITTDNNKVFLAESEKYIYDYLFSSEKNNFNIKEWYSIIEKEILNEEIGEKLNYLPLTRKYLIIYSIFFLPIVAYYIYNQFILNQDLMSTSIMGITYSILPIFLIMAHEKYSSFTKINLTEKGYILKHKIFSLKKNLKNLCIKNNNGLNNANFYKEYFIYSQLLNINKSYNQIKNIKMKILSNADLKDYIEKFIYMKTKIYREYDTIE